MKTKQIEGELLKLQQRKQSPIKFRIVFTFSKLFAVAILIVGYHLSLTLKDSSIILTAFGICGGLIGWKTYQDNKFEKNKSSKLKGTDFYNTDMTE